jgi:hypothetical protein
MLVWANISKPKLLALDALELELVPELDHDLATTEPDGIHEVLGKALIVLGTNGK